MKLRVCIALLIVSLGLSLGACSADRADPTVNSDSPGSTALPESENPSPADACKAVLQNEAYFVSADDSHEFLLDDFLNRDSEYAGVYTATRFAVLDMDGDGVPEVVLELSLNDYPEQYEILHYGDGAVYGYNVVCRGFEMPKEDGTYVYANGASDVGVEKILSFKPDSVETETLGYSQSDYSGDISYFIHGASAVKEDFDVFYAQQNEKNDVRWYEFTAENVEAKL